MTNLVKAKGLEIAGRLSRLSLNLAEGEVACLVGPNGSGKTSLLHALSGIGQAKGEVMVAGERLQDAAPERRARLLSFMPASRDISWPVAGHDLIRLGGASAAEADDIAAKLELAPLAPRRADRLSTGERARILLARALACSPRLLLLDEPLANLDPLWKIRLVELLRREAGQAGHAALVAVHDLDVAGALADRVIVMQGGAIAGDGPAADILNDPIIAQVFGVERRDGAWRAVSPWVDRRSSP